MINLFVEFFKQNLFQAFVWFVYKLIINTHCIFNSVHVSTHHLDPAIKIAFYMTKSSWRQNVSLQQILHTIGTNSKDVQGWEDEYVQ